MVAESYDTLAGRGTIVQSEQVVEGESDNHRVVQLIKHMHCNKLDPKVLDLTCHLDCYKASKDTVDQLPVSQPS